MLLFAHAWTFTRTLFSRRLDVQGRQHSQDLLINEQEHQHTPLVVGVSLQISMLLSVSIDTNVMELILYLNY